MKPNSMILKKLNELVTSLEKISSTKEKIETLKQYPNLRYILKIIYDKNFMFHVKGATISKHEIKSNDIYFVDDLITLLTKLNAREYTGYEALDHCKFFLNNYSQYSEVIIRIFNKDLKCGINTKTLEKAFAIKINTFSVPLARAYQDKLVNLDEETWYFSRKLDGVRCVVKKENNNIKFYSRTGKEFFTLDNLKSFFKKAYTFLNNDSIIFDGELCLLDDQGNENFSSVMKEITRKDHTIDNPIFFMFDFYDNMEEDNIIFSDKYSKMQELSLYFKENNIDLIRILKQEKLSDTNFSFPEEWEGLILRKDTYSEFKRSNNLLKVKNIKDDEFRVQDIQIGMKFIDGKHQQCCSALVIEYKNNLVGVGSGLTDEQRLEWLDVNKIVGKVITVKYFEESNNKKGEVSLRFPTLKAVHGYKRTT